MTMGTQCRCVYFPKSFKTTSCKDPPRRSCGKNGTEEQFCRLFSTQQRPNVFLSHARLAPATYHGRVLYTVTRVWVKAPHWRTPLTFLNAVARFVHRCLSQTLNLAVSDYLFVDCFSGRFGPTCAHCVCSLLLFFKYRNLCGEHQWSCVSRAPFMTRILLESIV